MNRTAITLLAAIAAADVAAQPATDRWSGDIEFGYISTDGNSNATNIKGHSDIKFASGGWENKFLFDALTAKSEGEKSAEKYFASDRLSYDFSKYNYVFAYASYEDDRFSGFDYRATGSLGYGRRLIERANMAWDAELGPGFRRSKVEDDTTGEEDSNEPILRAFSEFGWDFTPTARFEQNLSVESGEDNTVTKSITSLKTKVGAGIAMKLSYTVTHTDNVPDSRQHTDKETSVTVVYSF